MTALFVFGLMVVLVLTFAVVKILHSRDLREMTCRLTAEREHRETIGGVLARRNASFARFAESRARLERRCLVAEAHNALLVEQRDAALRKAGRAKARARR